MEISNNTFSSIIRNYDIEKINEQTQKTDLTEQNGLPELDKASNTDGFVRSDGSVADISDINFVSTYSVEETNNTVTATSEAEAYANSSSITNEELNYIKKLIYNSHHSFIENFRDADTFFEYVHNKQDSTVTKETGISRSQLIALTQNDKWEDSHNDFFGSLNRSFYSLDKDNNGTLSYAEVKDFLNTYLKKDGYNDFKTQVQAYSDEIQTKFDNASTKEKIQFAIDYTKEYLTAAGLTNQLDALNRLISMEDTFAESDDYRIGQISFRDLNKDREDGDPYTLGSYTAENYTISYTNSNTNTKPSGKTNADGSFTQHISFFDNDADNENNDLGICLDFNKYLKKGAAWDELVATLVHELTHATISQYTNLKNTATITITKDNITRLKNMGVFKNDAEYEQALQNINEINNKYQAYWLGTDGAWHNNDDNTKLPDNYQRILTELIYKGTGAAGEYVAYQADADFLDSIGGDIFTKGSAMSVDGKDEQQTIIDHINNCGYNDYTDQNGNPLKNEALPDWKWWSYA